MSTQDIHQDKILILDFGSQYAQLIARRVREIGVYCELHPYDQSPETLAAIKPTGVILSGGPESTIAENAPTIPNIIFELGCPVLGICYGMQAMAVQLGGAVDSADKREFGHATIDIVESAGLLPKGTALDVWMSHGDHVTALPEGFRVLAKTDNAPIAVIANEEKRFYGLQFHPEVTHTVMGREILENFVVSICDCDTAWTPENIIEAAVEDIRARVGTQHVLLGLSGGVDSSVLAALLHKAIGDQLTCVFVDNGLLRLNEKQQVLATFKEHMGVKVIAVDAQDLFYEALAGVQCPEEKRKIIGRTFIDVFDAEAKQIPNVKWLAQGTIYPDVIESAGSHSDKAHVIKSHHNVGGLPETMTLKLLEPLRELFKDEVRKLGAVLGLPHEMIYRHPFPGPGLGVRILGEVKPEYINLLQQADAIFIETLRAHEYYDKVSQAFVVFLPVKSVGVVGDARQYEYVVALRCVETVDFMTAKWSHLPYELLSEVSHRIINEVPGIARVTYDISGKPPATIEWE